MNLDKGEALRAIYTKILAAVEELAKKDGYQLVLFDERSFMPLPEGDANVSDNTMKTVIQSRRTLYAAPDIDITGDLVQLMNTKYAAGR
jgi:Skp family chaperone for outer membrane proteins